MTDDTYATDDQTSLAGGGQLRWRIEGARERLGRGLDLDIRTAVENRNARYFNAPADVGPQKLVTMSHKLRVIQAVVDAEDALHYLWGNVPAAAREVRW